MVCPSCGAQNEAGANFCAECGKRLPDLQVGATPAPVPPTVPVAPAVPVVPAAPAPAPSPTPFQAAQPVSAPPPWGQPAAPVAPAPAGPTPPWGQPPTAAPAAPAGPTPPPWGQPPAAPTAAPAMPTPPMPPAPAYQPSTQGWGQPAAFQPQAPQAAPAYPSAPAASGAARPNLLPGLLAVAGGLVAVATAWMPWETISGISVPNAIDLAPGKDLANANYLIAGGVVAAVAGAALLLGLLRGRTANVLLGVAAILGGVLVIAVEGSVYSDLSDAIKAGASAGSGLYLGIVAGAAAIVGGALTLRKAR